MKKSYLIGIAVGVLVIIGLGFLVSGQSTNQNQDSVSNNTGGRSSLAESVAPDGINSTGRYTEYSESAVADADFDTTILFFHAPWCPQCRDFEADILTSTIPNGVQILKVDFDSSTELKAKHGVTLQTTFVSVNPDGSQIKKWVGYSAEKSLNRILQEFS